MDGPLGRGHIANTTVRGAHLGGHVASTAVWMAYLGEVT
jgi:hypothetical protein